ncbi:MAG: hypothetical protein ACOC4E_00400 [Patescibacteria group bacterium]
MKPTHVTRSPNCPNSGITPTDPPEPIAVLKQRKHGLCGFCAWGFVTFAGKGKGEDPTDLGLTPLDAGYRSECGTVELYRDRDGRVGALRNGRFFPGIEGNVAFERYKQAHPHLFARQ